MATIKLQWCQDIKAERDLEAMGIPYEKKTVSFSRLDLASSRQNGARFEPILRPLVDDYKQGMINGDAFPRPVVHEIPGQLYFILSGIQRTASVGELIDEKIVAKDTPVDVYLVDTQDQMHLEAIARSGNVAHGGRASHEERIMHAVYMHVTLGMSVCDAAKLFMVSQTTINIHVNAAQTRRELAEAGIRTEHIPVSSLRYLDKVNFDASLKEKVGHLLSQHNPASDRVKTITDQLKKSKSEGERLKIVKTFERELSIDAQRKPPKGHPVLRKVMNRPRRDRILRDFQRLAEWLETGNDGDTFSTIGELQILTADDITSLRQFWSRVESRMAAILGRKGGR
jgi:hypothetical protein